jgi:hypothetical protein
MFSTVTSGQPWALQPLWRLYLHLQSFTSKASRDGQHGGKIAFNAKDKAHSITNMSQHRWLFLLEGLITLAVGVAAVFMMPASAVQTKRWFRPNGWFTTREVAIVVNRVLRDDPSKGDMHNRQPITPRRLWHALKDYDMYPARTSKHVHLNVCWRLCSCTLSAWLHTFHSMLFILSWTHAYDFIGLLQTPTFHSRSNH